MAKTLYLASNSPRRWQLLQQLGLNLLPLVSEIDETPYPNEPAKDYCLRLALEKNQAAQAVCFQQNFAEYPILTADTTVSIDHLILGKPKDKAEAFVMLSLLSGKTHQVYTAVCVSFQGKQVHCVQTSEVTFKVLTECEINAYIETQQPMDKAGAYGIQELGGLFIQHLSGSFTGVMGLPIYETRQLLEQCGIKLLV